MTRLQSNSGRSRGFSTLFGALGAAFLAWAGLPLVAHAASGPPLRAQHGVVASDHEAASAAGVELLRAGGNAIDAACATALALGVTVPHSSGLGGGGFALVWIAKEKKAYALDFREMAPAGIKTEMYFRDGKPDPALSTRGGLSVGVPGEARGLGTLVKRWGKLPWARCVEPAARLAKKGVPATERMAGLINDAWKDEARTTFLQQVWTLKRRPVVAGDPLLRPALATTLETLKKKGPDAFYEGPIADAIVKSVKDSGGVITADDLHGYVVKERTPLETTFRGKRVFTMPPASSGGIVITTALGILAEKVPDPKKVDRGSSAYLHLLVEALKHGFADRARHMGDTDFVEVPLDKLLAPAYPRELAARTKADGVLKSEAYGMPGAAPDPKTDGGTTHLSVIDAEGNAVALTTTVNLWFGAQLVAGTTGIVLNDQMDDFSIKPGTPNAFKLIGTDKNAVAPGKRPLSSMSPTLVIDNDQIRVAVGGAGGPTIISGTLQVLLNVVDFGMDAQAASAFPRVHHQWAPDALSYEPEIPRDVIDGLEKRGQKPRPRGHISSVNVAIKTDKGLEAASEYRSGGKPAGY